MWWPNLVLSDGLETRIPSSCGRACLTCTTAGGLLSQTAARIFRLASTETYATTKIISYCSLWELGIFMSIVAICQHFTLFNGNTDIPQGRCRKFFKRIFK